jgi:hypothetical protein
MISADPHKKHLWKTKRTSVIAKFALEQSGSKEI